MTTFADNAVVASWHETCSPARLTVRLICPRVMPRNPLPLRVFGSSLQDYDVTAAANRLVVLLVEHTMCTVQCFNDMGRQLWHVEFGTEPMPFAAPCFRLHDTLDSKIFASSDGSVYITTDVRAGRMRRLSF